MFKAILIISLGLALASRTTARRTTSRRHIHRNQMLNSDAIASNQTSELPPKMTIADRRKDRSTLSYVWSGIQGQGVTLKELYCKRSKDGCKTVDGWPDHQFHYTDMDGVVEQLGKAPEREVRGEIRRMGDLGGFIFNEYLWEDDWMTFPIGADLEDHRTVRPIADFVLGEQSREGPKGWTRDIIREHVQEFFSKTRKFGENDVKLFVSKLLHRVFFNVKITDIEAVDFEYYKSASLVAAIVPKFLASDSLTGMPWAKKQRKLQLEKFMDWIQKDTRGVYPKDLDGRDLRFTADFCLTAMTSAGGVSIPMIIRHALALVYGAPPSRTEGPLPPEVRRLSDDTLKQFVYETVRRYPAVLGFPWWTPDIKERFVPNVGMALLDERAWGADVEKFKIRPLSEYEAQAGYADKIGVAWAEQAKGPNGLTPDSRGCPARDLSMAIIEEFLRGIMPMQDDWKIVGKIPKKGLEMPEGAAASLADFTLSRGNESVTEDDTPSEPSPENDEARAKQMSHSFDHDFIYDINALVMPKTRQFTCPEPCLQCCEKLGSMWQRDKTVFKCLIHSDPTAVQTFKVLGRECSAPKTRNSEDQWAKAKCKFSKAEIAAGWYKELGKCKAMS